MSSSITISFKIIEFIPNNLNYNNFSFVFKNEQNFEDTIKVWIIFNFISILKIILFLINLKIKKKI